MPLDMRLYLVLDPERTGGRDPVAVAEAALRGGVTVLQLRWKNGPLREMLRLGEALRDLCRRYGVPFLVNDRVDAALALAADGVHVGQEDLPAAVARRLLGPQAYVGVSARTPEQARAAEAEGADYLGTGSVFPTGSKENAIWIGLEGLARVAPPAGGSHRGRAGGERRGVHPSGRRRRGGDLRHHPGGRSRSGSPGPPQRRRRRLGGTRQAFALRFRREPCAHCPVR